MSSIFSDPWFRRGTTLLSGEAIELDGSNPVAGEGIVGSIKVFQDVNPTTGTRNSNRLVYCVAARYKGSTVTAANMDAAATTLRGRLFRFDSSKPLTEITSLATTNATPGTGAATLAANEAFGVIDEYLTGEVRQNDIIWVVVKGPTQAYTTTGAITAGAVVTVSNATASSAGTIASGTTLPIGQSLAAKTSTDAAAFHRINLKCDFI